MHAARLEDLAATVQKSEVKVAQTDVILICAKWILQFLGSLVETPNAFEETERQNRRDDHWFGEASDVDGNESPKAAE